MANTPDQQDHERLARATALLRSGQWELARSECLRLREDSPDFVEASYLLGVIYQETRQFAQAVSCYVAVLRRREDHVDALNNLGTVLEQTGHGSRALDCYRRAAGHGPGHLQAHYNTGRMLRAQGRPGEARRFLDTALGLSPDSVPVLYESGLVLKALGEYGLALERLWRASRISPDDAAVMNVIGNVLQLQGELSRAIEAYRRAAVLKNGFAVARNNLGSALLAQGEVSAAMEQYYEASRLDPEWHGACSNALLAGNYITDDAERLFMEHRRFGTLLESRFDPDPPELTGTAGRMIRVGYVSPDFRSHSVAYFLEGLFRWHNRERFEIVCFSDVASPDLMTDRLRGLVSEWHEIHGLSDRRAFRCIRDAGIDILVDLAGHTSHNRMPVFAMQPAPVQVSYLGYPNTTGLSRVAYRFTDAYADPPGSGDALYTERLLRLPRCFVSYSPPAECPSVAGLPLDANGYVTWGSFNVLAKMSDACIETWAAILEATPGSRLVLKSAGLQDAVTCDLVRRRFDRYGISSQRLELVGRTRDFHSHMAWYNRVDIALDTFPYNGTTTSCEALWMGVPVITLAGACHAARTGSSLLHAAGLGDCVSGGREDYMAIACRLAADPARLRALRSGLRDSLASSPLCDSPALAAAIEAEYGKMLEG